MAFPWLEAGIVLSLSGVLWLMGHVPVPLIGPAEVEDYEARTVRIAGFVDDVEIGVDAHRGVLTAQGQAVRFHADGVDAPDEGQWVELRGTLHRERGELVLRVQANSWTP